MSNEQGKLKKESDIKEEIKKIPKEKTLAQTLLPGVILLIIGTIITLSFKYVKICDTSCLLSGGGIGSVSLVALYIIGKAIKYYLIY